MINRIKIEYYTDHEEPVENRLINATVQVGKHASTSWVVYKRMWIKGNPTTAWRKELEVK